MTSNPSLGWTRRKLTVLWKNFEGSNLAAGQIRKAPLRTECPPEGTPGGHVLGLWDAGRDQNGLIVERRTTISTFWLTTEPASFTTVTVLMKSDSSLATALAGPGPLQVTVVNV